MDALILRLRGPLMSFGDVAVDELRPTDFLPGISFLVGLIGNALGWLYTDHEKLQRLQDRLVLASRLETRPELMRDYQNAEIHEKDLVWRSKGKPDRRLSGLKGKGIVQRERFYLANASVTVAFSLIPADAAPTLDDVEDALRRPARPLFLGRVCCPPSAPLYRGERFALEPAEALRAAGNLADKGLKGETGASFFLEEIPARDFTDCGHLSERRDLRDWKGGVHCGSRLVYRRQGVEP